MITTADWLAYIDSLGPSDAQSMRMRLQSAGADAERAEWLVSMVWRRQLSRYVARVAVVFLIVGAAWAAYLWWLALSGSLRGPEIKDTIAPCIIIAVGALALLIASAVELSPPLDLTSHRAIPSELPPPPRRIAESGDRRALSSRLLCGIVAMMVVPAVISTPRVRDRVVLQKQGIDATGKVIDVYTRKGSKGSIRHYVRYAFEKGEGVQSVEREDFPTYHPGDSVPVTYLPARPDISAMQSKADLMSGSFFGDPVLARVLAFFVVMIIVVFVILNAVMKRVRRIAERGIPVVAEITKTRGQAIEYRFGEITGKYVYGKRSLRERPAVGEPIVILYDPENPKRHMPLGALSDLRLT